jgi:hypothetical protein
MPAIGDMKIFKLKIIDKAGKREAFSPAADQAHVLARQWIGLDFDIPGIRTMLENHRHRAVLEIQIVKFVDQLRTADFPLGDRWRLIPDSDLGWGYPSLFFKADFRYITDGKGLSGQLLHAQPRPYGLSPQKAGFCNLCVLRRLHVFFGNFFPRKSFVGIFCWFHRNLARLSCRSKSKKDIFSTSLKKCGQHGWFGRIDRVWFISNDNDSRWHHKGHRW